MSRSLSCRRRRWIHPPSNKGRSFEGILLSRENPLLRVKAFRDGIVVSLDSSACITAPSEYYVEFIMSVMKKRTENPSSALSTQGSPPPKSRSCPAFRATSVSVPWCACATPPTATRSRPPSCPPPGGRLSSRRTSRAPGSCGRSSPSRTVRMVSHIECLQMRFYSTNKSHTRCSQ